MKKCLSLAFLMGLLICFQPAVQAFSLWNSVSSLAASASSMVSKMYSNTFCRVGAAATVAVLSIAAAKALYRYYQEKQETEKLVKGALDLLLRKPQGNVPSGAAEGQIEIVDYDQARDYDAVKDIVDHNQSVLTKTPIVMSQARNDDFYRTLVIRKAGTTIGFIIYRLFMNPNEPAHNDASWCIRFLAISAEHQGKGYGTRLIQAAEQELINRGITILDITVIHANEHAKNLYERLGFVLQKGKDPFGGVYLMRKQLSASN